MRAVFRQMLVLALVALGPAGVAALYHPKRPAWQSDEVPLLVAQGWQGQTLWIDARPRSDFEQAHVPGALPLNEDAWQDLLPPVLDAWSPDSRVVVYCSKLSCQTSHEVARRLRDEVGLPQVFVLQGGWESWVKAGAR
jgi:rhodanese-related sulfurtransferase